MAHLGECAGEPQAVLLTKPELCTQLSVPGTLLCPPHDLAGTEGQVSGSPGGRTLGFSDPIQQGDFLQPY